MNLDEMLSRERATCPDTSSAAWKLRCEVFHYAKQPRDVRLASLNGMRSKGYSERADKIATEVNVLLQQLGIRDRNAYPGREAPASSKFAKLGQPWTSSDDEFLRTEFSNGATTEKLAKLLGRTERAISMRLEKLKLAA